MYVINNKEVRQISAVIQLPQDIDTLLCGMGMRPRVGHWTRNGTLIPNHQRCVELLPFSRQTPRLLPAGWRKSLCYRGPTVSATEYSLTDSPRTGAPEHHRPYNW